MSRDIPSLFPQAKRAGDGFMARCPAHEDRQASLSIGYGDDGRVLLKCHAGCDFTAICTAAGIDPRELFPDATREVRTVPPPARAPRVIKGDAFPGLGLPVATYDYTDEQGLLLSQNCRFNTNPKTFRQRQPAINGTRGWIWSTEGVRRVLYRLPELYASVTKRIGIVEGEKDVDSLVALGITATTSVGGASKNPDKPKWTGEYTQQLVAAGIKSATILPDNDEPGRAHALAVARSCHAAGIDVRVVELPGLPPGGDVSDWIAAGHTKADLVALVTATPIWTPTTSPTTPAPASAPAPTAPALDDETGATAVPTIDEVLTTCGLATFVAPVDIGQLEIGLRQLQQAMRGVDTLRRAAVRETLVTRLKVAGVKTATRIVDASLQDAASADDATTGGLSLTDDEPWPDPVDGADLLDALVARLNEHLVLPARAAPAIALWILHSYLMDVWQVSPLLMFTSPTKRCGKSTTLMLVTSLCPRRLLASNLTPAVLFRIVDRYRPTLSIDEADTLLKDNDELRAVINAGYLRQTANVPRCIGDDHEPTLLSSWCPKLIGMIGMPPDTVADRSILVPMKRKGPGDAVTRLRADRLESGALALRRQATRWARDFGADVMDADPEVPGTLHDRAQDNWRPLLALADAAAGHWPETARLAARTLSGDLDSDDSEAASVVLLGDIRMWFDEQDEQPEIVESATLVTYLTSLETRPWSEWRAGKPLTAVSLSRLLKGYDIRPTTARVGTRTPKAYRRDNFTDAWDRYLSLSSRNTRNNPIDTGRNVHFQPATSENRVADAIDDSLNESAPCCGVADENREADGKLLL